MSSLASSRSNAESVGLGASAPGLALISAATLGLEVALTRVLSVSLWYHFAFLVISTAVLGFGLAGVVFVAWEARSRFAIVASAWAIGLFLAYSLIGYKTPWLMLNWVVPFALVGGYAIGRAWNARRTLLHVGVPVVLAGALAFSGVQAALLAFRDYDNDTNAYVYVPTKRDLLSLVDWIRSEDAIRGAGGQIGVVIMSPDYWPLPWYLRDDKKAGFYGSVVDVAAPIQIVRTDQVPSLPAAFDAKYERVGQYTLRGGVDLVVYLDRGGG